MNNQLQIPSIFSDNTTTIKNHSIKTHIFCILLRIIIGFLIKLIIYFNLLLT